MVKIFKSINHIIIHKDLIYFKTFMNFDLNISIPHLQRRKGFAIFYDATLQALILHLSFLGALHFLFFIFDKKVSLLD